MASVLVIEDDRVILEHIGLFLEREGFEVYLAPDGVVGFSIYEMHCPDLVIIDIHLPDKHGLTTIREMQNLAPFQKIMAMSGDDLMLKLARMFGVPYTISKPFDACSLIASVHRIIHASPLSHNVLPYL